MFVLVQLPVSDRRSLGPGERGRLNVPDWTADDPGASFVRGFGKMATRNSKGFGLVGERVFCDFNNSVKLMETLNYQQSNWPRDMQVELRFRRLYFDGKLAGRFEFGFIVEPDIEDHVRLQMDGFGYNVQKLSKAILDLKVVVRSLDEGERHATVGTCSDALGLSYVMATTRQRALIDYPVEETYGKFVAIGNPLVHVRVSADKVSLKGRDRRQIEEENANLFITSVSQWPTRNNLIVQLTQTEVHSETADERATRVVFAHINALIFAQSHLLRVQKEVKLATKATLSEAVQNMLARFEHFKPVGPEAHNDSDFARAISRFGAAYAGRQEEIVKKIEEFGAELSKPSGASKVKNAAFDGFQWIAELVIKTGVSTAVSSGMKGA